jgi:hypothetical protein
MCYAVLSAAGGIRVQNQNMSTGIFCFFSVWLYLCSLLTLVGYFLDLVRSITYLPMLIVVISSISGRCGCHRRSGHINWLILHATLWDR